MENVEEVVYDPTEELCEIIKEGDNYYCIDLASGENLGVLTDTVDNGLKIPKNRSNRKWVSKVLLKRTVDQGIRLPLTYKATKKLGPIGNRLPNEKLIAYLSEEDQAEYKAIIARAYEAKNAAKVQPMTELEKAQAKLAKAQAALEKLLAEAGE